MKHNKGFFSAAVLKKDLTRFAPLWVLYTVFLLINLSTRFSFSELIDGLPAILKSMALVNLVYAFVCALTLFRYLYISRICNALHAMPLRREGVFFTHCVAGLLFCLIPNVLCAFVGAIMLKRLSYLVLWALAAIVLQFVFFFGMGVFCALCAGNALGATAIYLLGNFITAFFSLFAHLLKPSLLYGTYVPQTLSDLCPAIRLIQAQYLNIYPPTDNIVYDNLPDPPPMPLYVAEDYLLLGLAAIAGIALLGLAVLLYRHRKIESAGDFAAVKGVSWVFLLSWMLLCGAALYIFSVDRHPVLGAGLYLLGIALGFFSGKMMIMRRVNVFHKKNILTFFCLAAVLISSFFFTQLDPLNFSKYVPEANAVESVQIAPYDNRSGKDRCTVTDPEGLQTILQAHKYCVDNPTESSDVGLWLRYTLKNGITMKRYYDLDPESDVWQQLKFIYSNPEYLFGFSDLQDLFHRAYFIEYDSYYKKISDFAIACSEEDMSNKYVPKGAVAYVTPFTTDTNILTLIEAMERDFASGHMPQAYVYHTSHARAGCLTIHYYAADGSMQYITIFTNHEAIDTLEALKQLTAQ